mgnify:FL=1
MRASKDQIGKVLKHHILVNQRSRTSAVNDKATQVMEAVNIFKDLKLEPTVLFQLFH